MLQDWLICSLPTFLALPVEKGVWSLSVVFLSSSINLHLIKLFPVLLSAKTTAGDGRCLDLIEESVEGMASKHTEAKGGGVEQSDTSVTTTAAGAAEESAAMRNGHKLGQNEIALFVTAAQDFHAKLSTEQKVRFETAFEKHQPQLDNVYVSMLQSLRGRSVAGGASVVAGGGTGSRSGVERVA